MVDMVECRNEGHKKMSEVTERKSRWTSEEKLTFKRELEMRTRKFAVSVFRYLDILPNINSCRVIAYQLGKSASSIGANYREANRSESADDFIHKIGISLKECDESHYWLEVLSELRTGSDNLPKLLKECDELLRILQTVNRKLRAKKGRA